MNKNDSSKRFWLLLISIPLIIVGLLIVAVFVLKWFSVSNDAWVAIGIGLITTYAGAAITNHFNKPNIDPQEEKQKELLDLDNRETYKPQLEFGCVLLNDQQLHYKHEDSSDKKGIYGEEQVHDRFMLRVEVITPKRIDAYDLKYCETKLSYAGLPQIERRSAQKWNGNSCYSFSFEARDDSDYELSFDIQSTNQFGHKYHQPFKIVMKTQNKKLQWRTYLGSIADGETTLSPLLKT